MKIKSGKELRKSKTRVSNDWDYKFTVKDNIVTIRPSESEQDQIQKIYDLKKRSSQSKRIWRTSLGKKDKSAIYQCS